MNPDETIFILARDKFDLYLIERSLQYGDLRNPIRVSRHAHEAACYFHGHGVYADRQAYPLPGLLILDLQLPQDESFALLEWLRAQRAFHDLPIIGTGVWRASPEVQRAFERGLNAYFRIPSEIMSLVAFTQQLGAVGQFGPLPA